LVELRRFLTQPSRRASWRRECCSKDLKRGRKWVEK
jgi:hypothetical protein